MSTMSLSQVLDAELEKTQGGVPACGAAHHGDTTQPCQRIANHEELAMSARESHARFDWSDDRYAPGMWVTWINVTSSGRPTSELTKPDAQ